MALYFGTTEITNIDNLVPQSGLDIADLWFGETNVYTVWQTYEGTLPATLNANGDDMRQYQIWGNGGGVGEEVDITGLNEPLCGIGTYTDSLDLSTGTLTRRLKKLVLTGGENWRKNDTSPNSSLYYLSDFTDKMKANCTCTHFPQSRTPYPANNQISANATAKMIYIYLDKNIINSMPSGNTKEGFEEFLAAQYAAGKPVTVWYVLAQPEASTITVPSGLTGALEGYLIQDGTPTPETPIYPTANGVKQADDTYSIKYGYKLDMSVSDSTNATTTSIYIGDTPLDKDEYVDYQAQKVYRMINGTLTPTDPPVPLPALPACEGTTIVDYVGSGTAPEKVLLKYRKEGY